MFFPSVFPWLESFHQRILLILIILCGDKSLSISTIFRFSSTIPNGLGGFLSTDVMSFFRQFHLGFRRFFSLISVVGFFFIDVFLTTFDPNVPATFI